uniref:Myosin motor domain-containing protein n=1 Tax=Wuchereria bancrofti TaxID=6293 RepID=A0A1I8EZA4_WUCBA
MKCHEDFKFQFKLRVLFYHKNSFFVRNDITIKLNAMDVEGLNMHVWAPDDKDGFVLCKIVDIGCEWVTLQRLHQTETETFQAFYDNIFPAGEDISRDVDDNCSLIYLNDGSLLNNCRLRYNRKQFYTYVANILIAINPYEQISSLYDIEMVHKYKGKSLGTLPPHIFAVADKAYRDMMSNHESQSVIISGESGAGKTESQKHIIRFLCESWGHLVGTIEQRILEISTILESFGNAKTACNNNSSRFGKFVEIHFNEKGIIVGGFVSHYLLERSRLCGQNVCERNYHIFYQLIAGADDQMANKLKLNKLEIFDYLNKGCMQFFLNKESSSKVIPGRKKYDLDDMRDDLIDDYNDFQRLLDAFSHINVSEDIRDGVFEIVAAVLHLGNIEFSDETVDFKSGCNLTKRSEIYLVNTAELLGIEVIDLRKHLVTRLMQPTRSGTKGTLYAIPLRASEATAARDALAKAIYSNLFTAIVNKIAECMPFDGSAFSIGVLDTAGFESLDVNSYEQFCINYCNEKLQNFFNERILMDEQNLYCKEQLHCDTIEFNDNKDCIGLNYLNKRYTASLNYWTMNHACHVPPRSISREQCMKPIFVILVPQSSPRHRTMRDDEGFIICHYAADVCYDTAQFLNKNNDTLHASLQCLMQQSRKSLVYELFTDNGFSNTDRRDVSQSKLMNASVGNKFRSQLDILLSKLRETGTHFVRCIKPNSEMKSNQFNGAQVLLQLKCSGMSSALKVMQRGFPSRISYLSLYNIYQKHLPSKLMTLDAQLLCKCLFRVVGLEEKDYKFGLTKAFFRHGKFAEFDKIQHLSKENIENLIERISSWLYRFRFRRAQFAVICLVKVERLLAYRAKCRIKIQSAARTYILHKLYRPRINALSTLSELLESINGMYSLINKLNETDLCKWTTFIHITSSADREIFHQCDALVNDAKEKQQVATNGLLEMQVDRENFEKEQQSQLKNEFNQQINEKAQETQQMTESLDESLERKVIMIAKEKSQMLENSHMIQVRDLSKWYYVDIRNGINSSDPKLSSACKNEYYRRMRAYNEWKERNLASKELTYMTEKNGSKEDEDHKIASDRYFRIVASRLTNREKNLFGIMGKSHFTVWYGHFRNEFIYRQIEISPKKSPILSVTGQHNKNMCKLSLKKTTLSKRKGAEISAARFDRIWMGNGGDPHLCSSEIV